MSNYNTLTLTKALQLIADKEISSQELYDDTHAAIEKENPKLNAYLSHQQQTVEASGPLAGAPIAVKDNFLTSDLPTTASSKVLEGFRPPFESTVVTKIREAGGSVIGKTNLDAWAHGSSTETSDFGRTLNARNPKHLPGGSSGGSASAVAGDLCLAAVGTETAGSIRQPASWCGVVGLKPSYGRCSRAGIVPMASSTDSPGPIGKTVEDTALLLNHISGHDPYDATTPVQEVPDFTKVIDKPISDMKIGYLYHELEGFDETKKLFESQLGVFEDLGAHVEKATALDPHYAISVYTVVQRAEVSSNMARFTGVRYGKDRSHFGDEARRRVMLGTYTLSKGYADQYYTKAQKVRALFAQDFDKLFKKYDVLVSLSSPGYAKKVGATEGSVMFGELEDMFQEPSSITGLPGISIPCLRDEKTNLYLGMNIVSPMFREDVMIQVADAFEKATPWNSWRNNEK